MLRLSEEFDVLSKNNVIDKEIPDYIVHNLNPKFELRPYQKEAIARFFYYLQDYQEKIQPIQLLYHMATGSGKTLLMAANIIYLYKKGYRKFLFFVNSTETIEKTRDNFLNKNSSKYLFSQSVSFDGKQVNIREVDNFESVNDRDINIVFTTIQGLHSKLTLPRENSITFEDFNEKKIVLLSDEAHHINALTKSRLSKSDQLEKDTWEGTVNRIFHKNRENILLEYTATVDLDHPAVKEKYNNKIIYQYSLKQFRLDRYSKDVNVLEGDFERKTRVLQALILSQYRRKVAEKHKVFLKPVAMMKSKVISMSEDFEEEFHKMIKTLTPRKLMEIKNKSGSSTIREAFGFFEENHISLANLVKEFKEDFDEEKCVSINSKNESEEKQILINTLEDENNQVRVVFAVDKLNEGWDVLNLFDIVRLYETRGSRYGKPGKTTISEAQLIGRGARYFPFRIDENQEKYKRKYDEDLESELRVLEELFYHCYNEPRYISELKIALEEQGIIPERRKEVRLKIKDAFKKTPFWRNGLIFINEQKQEDRSNVRDLKALASTQIYKHKLKTGYSIDIAIFDEEGAETQGRKSRIMSLSEFRENILRKALDQLEFYRFNNLKRYFPNVSSIKEFLSSKKYLGQIEVEITGAKEQIEKLRDKDKLEVSLNVFREVSNEIKSNSSEYRGTKVFIAKPVKEVMKDKVRKFDIDDNGDKETGKPMKKSGIEELRMDLSKKSWYVYNENYGTSQEKYFVKFINDMIDKMKEKYDDIYLVRNEKLFQLYDFSDGQAIEPDFVLFLRKKNSSEALQYQIFVEPKGQHLIPSDKWKEDFLKEIEEKHTVEVLQEDHKYRIIGLPFYNEDVTKKEFREIFNEKLNLA